MKQLSLGFVKVVGLFLRPQAYKLRSFTLLDNCGEHSSLLGNRLCCSCSFTLVLSTNSSSCVSFCSIRYQAFYLWPNHRYPVSKMLVRLLPWWTPRTTKKTRKVVWYPTLRSLAKFAPITVTIEGDVSMANVVVIKATCQVIAVLTRESHPNLEPSNPRAFVI